MVTGFEIRRGRVGTTCVWGDCDLGEERRRGQGRGGGFAEVVILDRESFPVCRRHRRELDEILCSLLPDPDAQIADAVSTGAVA